LRELVLAFEELEPAERAEATAHLAACTECASLLDSLRRAEHLARPVGALPPLDVPPALSADERRAADASLEALRVHLLSPDQADPDATRREAELRRGGGRSWLDVVFGTPARRAAAMLVPVAASLVLLFYAREQSRPVVIRGAEVLALSTARGDAPGLHTGDAFGIRVNLSKPAYPVVLHVSPGGSFTILHPPSGSPPALRPAGESILPAPGGAIEWRLEGESGIETFLIAASRRSDVDIARLAEEAKRLEAGDRAERRRALEALLARRVGPVRVVEVTHLP
jgi:hypothetical protein